MKASSDFHTNGRGVHADGTRMKKFRLHFGLTQEQVAAATGYSDRLVRKLENGGTVSPRTYYDFLSYYEGLSQQRNVISAPHAIAQVEAKVSAFELESIALHWFERAFNQRDLSVIEEVFASDVELIAEGKTLIGHDVIRNRVGAVLAAFDPLRIEIEELLTQEDTVVAYWVVEKTHSGAFFGLPPTGRTVVIRGSSMAKCQDGMIVQVRDHWDVDDLIRKLTVEE